MLQSLWATKHSTVSGTTFDYPVQGDRLSTQRQTNREYFLPILIPIPLIPLSIMNKMLFYAPNYYNPSNQRSTSNHCGTSDQQSLSNRCQLSNPRALMMGFPLLGGGQEISTDGILPTRSQSSPNKIFSSRRTVSVHSVDGIFSTQKCRCRHPSGTLWAILQESKPSAVGFS